MTTTTVTTTSELCTKFLMYIRYNRTIATYRFHKFFADKFLTQVPENLSELKSYHLTRFADRWKDNSRRNAIRSIKTAFNWLVEQDYIDRNPFQKIKRPQEIYNDDCLTPEQYNQVLEVSDSKFKQIIVFMRLTGCRVSELRQLTSNMLNEHCFIIPRVQAKGKCEERIILLNKDAYIMVKDTVGFIFKNRYGKAYTASALHFHSKKLSKKLGFPFHLGLLRKVFITEAIINGVDIITLAKIVGHRNLKMIQMCYAKVHKRSEFMFNALDKCLTH